MQVPMGVQDFKRIRDGGGYYIDKTPLIDRILSDGMMEVFQFTRPRRFGKSTNLSMLDAYLNMDYRGNTWFDGLRISELRPDDPDKNANPVIYIDLKNIDTRTYGLFLRSMGYTLADVCREHANLGTSRLQDHDDLARFADLKAERADETSLMNSLRLLSSMLKTEYGRPAVILIDEYDHCVNESYGAGHQRDVLMFMKGMLSSALKGNPFLRFGVVTGIAQIVKESIFSGLNNLYVDNILSTQTDEMFGFTSDEVRKLCTDFGHPEKFDEAKDWYDGYRFGNADIYNPWSVLSYVRSGFVPGKYWAGTSGNSIIDDLISMLDEETIGNLMTLGSGGTIGSDLEPGVTFADISDRGRGIYCVMAFSGYLKATVSEDGYVLSIPNREMYGVFADMVMDRLGSMGLNTGVRVFCRSVLAGDTERMTGALTEMLRDSVSFRVLGHETSYQLFVVGLLMSLYGNYRITADFESGDGCHDIRMERLHGSGPNVVIEIKRASSESDPDSLTGLARNALRQIHDRDYAHGLKGETVLYGIAFGGKRPAVVSETVRLRPPVAASWTSTRGGTTPRRTPLRTARTPASRRTRMRASAPPA